MPAAPRVMRPVRSPNPTNSPRPPAAAIPPELNNLIVAQRQRRVPANDIWWSLTEAPE